MRKNEESNCLGVELNPVTVIVKEWFEKNRRLGAQKQFLCSVLVAGLMESHYTEELAVEVISEKIENMFVVDAFTCNEKVNVLDGLIDWLFSQIDFEALAKYWLDSALANVQQ